MLLEILLVITRTLKAESSLDGQAAHVRSIKRSDTTSLQTSPSLVLFSSSEIENVRTKEKPSGFDAVPWVIGRLFPATLLFFYLASFFCLFLLLLLCTSLFYLLNMIPLTPVFLIKWARAVIISRASTAYLELLTCFHWLLGRRW